MSELSALSNFPIDDIQNLRTMVEAVKSALRNQDELLRMRGMSLPPGSLSQLDTIDTDLKQLHKNLVNESSELLQLRTLAETSAMLNSCHQSARIGTSSPRSRAGRNDSSKL